MKAKMVERLKVRISLAEQSGRAERTAHRKVYWSGVRDGLRTALRIIQRYRPSKSA